MSLPPLICEHGEVRVTIEKRDGRRLVHVEVDEGPNGWDPLAKVLLTVPQARELAERILAAAREVNDLEQADEDAEGEDL